MRGSVVPATVVLAVLAAAPGCAPKPGGAQASKAAPAQKPGPAEAPRTGPESRARPGPESQEPRGAGLQQRRLLYDIYNNLPPSPAKEEGLESAEGWAAADWEDPATLRLINDRRAGRRMIYLGAEPGPRGKCGAKLPREMSLASKGALRLAAYNYGSEAVKVAAAFWVSGGWVYYESTARELPAGRWTELSFDLEGRDYKTPGSGWKHTASLWKREETKQLAVLVYGGGKAVKVLIDGVFADQAPAPPAEKTPAKPAEPGPARAPEKPAPPPEKPLPPAENPTPPPVEDGRVVPPPPPSEAPAPPAPAPPEG